jgi:hypothetical protein
MSAAALARSCPSVASARPPQLSSAASSNPKPAKATWPRFDLSPERFVRIHQASTGLSLEDKILEDKLE